MENENLKGKLLIKDGNIKELSEKVEKTRHEVNKIKLEVILILSRIFSNYNVLK